MSDKEIPRAILPILQAHGWRQLPGYTRSGAQAAVIAVTDASNRRGAFRMLTRETKEDVQRFDREVAILTDSRFQHPSVVNIFDVSGPGEGHWYVSQLGKPFESYWKSSKQRAGRGVLESVGIIRQLAAGLESLHKQGVVHRDIKPHNIVVVRRDGKNHPVLIDFGIAYRDSDVRLTAVDAAVGPRAYSPDAMRNKMEEIPPWLDVFELAQVLIWMLSAKDAKAHWERPAHWKYVRYPAWLDPDLVTRVRAVTALCSIEMAGPKNASELLALLDSYFPEVQSDPLATDRDTGYAALARGRLRGKAERDIRHAEDSEFVASCFPAFEIAAAEFVALLKAIASELEKVSIAVKVNIEQSPTERYESLVQLREEVSAGTLLNMIVGDHPATFMVVLRYVALSPSFKHDRQLVRPDGANVFAFKLSREERSSRSFRGREAFVTIESTGAFTRRNAEMKRIQTVTLEDIAALVRDWIDDEELSEELHAERAPAPRPWRIDDSAFEELDGDERAAISILGRLALERDRLPGIPADMLIQRAAAGGVDVNGVLQSLKRLHRRRYILAEQHSRELPHDVHLRDDGFEVYAAALVPRYGKLVTDIVQLIIGGDHDSNVHLEITVGRPRVLINHVLKLLSDNGLIRIFDQSSIVSIDEFAELREWARANGVEPQRGTPKRVAVDAFVEEMDAILESDDLTALDRGWWEPLRKAQRIASESGARDSYAPGLHAENHRLLQALGHLGFMSDETHSKYVADNNSREYQQAISEARAALAIVRAKVREAQPSWTREHD